VGKFEELKDLMGRDIEGSLEGSLSYDGEIGSLTEGAGEADLRLFNGRIELREPVLSIDVIEFSEVSIRLSLKNRKMKLTHVELKGPNMYGTLSGTISVRREFLDSHLDLKGTVDPSEGFFEVSEGASVTVPLLAENSGSGLVSFAIRGTFKKPRLDLI
jgi:type II secretion system protein N